MAALTRYKRLPKGFASRALSSAVSTSNLFAVQLLLSNGVDPNTIARRVEPYGYDRFLFFQSSPKSRLPLITALQFDQSRGFGVIQALLDAGADPNRATGQSDSWPAFEVAIRRGSPHLVQMLINAGADVDLRNDSNGGTPLMFATQWENMDIIELLLNHEADVNAAPHDFAGATALQYACMEGSLGVVRALLERGADVDAAPAKKGGRTAIEGAAEYGRIDVLFELVNAGAQLIGSGNGQYLRARERATENGHLALRDHLQVLRNRQQADFDAGLTLPVWNEGFCE